MHEILEDIFKNGKYKIDNKSFFIHSETSRDQCLFLQKLIHENNCKSSIEIGLAYGISTLAIIEAIKKIMVIITLSLTNFNKSIGIILG